MESSICLRCSELMHVYDDERNALGKRLRCTPCNTDESVKRGSIFEHFHTPLVKLCELLCYFDAELTVTQTAHLTSISDDTISTFWKRIRESTAVFNEEHPVMYGPGYIVEIDEAYVKAVLEINKEIQTNTSGIQSLGVLLVEVVWLLSTFVQLIVCMIFKTPYFHISHRLSPLSSQIAIVLSIF